MSTITRPFGPRCPRARNRHHCEYREQVPRVLDGSIRRRCGVISNYSFGQMEIAEKPMVRALADEFVDVDDMQAVCLIVVCAVATHWTTLNSIGPCSRRKFFLLSSWRWRGFHGPQSTSSSVTVFHAVQSSFASSEEWLSFWSSLAFF